MFSKSKSEETKATDGKPVKPAVPSIISDDLTITGNLLSKGEIQIDGRIEGDIDTETLLVGEFAHINGDIRAERVRVYGHVNGQITAQSVTLASTAHVTGDVVHEDLSIDKGAFL
ncbi:MAG: polymer-forming cytoskeletal protein, partial [Rhodospirillales bacterium]|nr:polymer-forming cytoskeletal protein [Rhodospirillales bacterium]